jgi:hypothetical protein
MYQDTLCSHTVFLLSASASVYLGNLLKNVQESDLHHGISTKCPDKRLVMLR